MLTGVSRRELLSIGAAGLSTGIAGCSAVEGFTSEPTELLFTFWNLDTRQSHELFLEVFEANAEDSEGGEVLDNGFKLARAADTEEGEEFNEASRKKHRIESRPYLIRVELPESEYTQRTTHFHFHPCTESNLDDLDRLTILLIPDEMRSDLTIQFVRPNCS